MYASSLVSIWVTDILFSSTGQSSLSDGLSSSWLGWDCGWLFCDLINCLVQVPVHAFQRMAKAISRSHRERRAISWDCMCAIRRPCYHPVAGCSYRSCGSFHTLELLSGWICSYHHLSGSFWFCQSANICFLHFRWSNCIDERWFTISVSLFLSINCDDKVNLPTQSFALVFPSKV